MMINNLDLSTVSASAVAIVPIIVALTQLLKTWVDNKFAPLIAIGLGILITLLADHNTNDWSYSLLSGVVYGLSASGLYSGVKAVAHADDEEDKDKKVVKK
jgi:hypothetical protein